VRGFLFPDDDQSEKMPFSLDDNVL
jgi:hypothetical protein